MTDSRPDDDEPRERDVGQGYPEEAPSGAGIDAREHAEQDIDDADDAPDPSKPEDDEPSHATGNPRAAGG